MRHIGEASWRLLGLANLIGAAAFFLLTSVLWILFHRNINAAEEIVLVCLGIVASGFAFAQTRRTAAGFVFAFVVLTPVHYRFTEIWWSPVTRQVWRATRPVARWMEQRQQHRAWVDGRRGLPVDVKDALVLLGNLHSGCIPSYTSHEGAAIPADVAAIFGQPECDRFQPTLLDSAATYPARYFPSDTGWRWDYARTSESTGRFRIVLRPDRLLDLPGPIVEVTGDGWYRVRAGENAPFTMLRTPVPMMARLRECVPLAAAAVDPKYPVLWEYLSEPSYLARVCRDLIIDTEQDSAEGDRVILVRRTGVATDPLGPAMLHYRALSPGRFEIRGWSFGRRYLLDADGALHAASARGPGLTEDGPPDACEVTQGTACGTR